MVSVLPELSKVAEETDILYLIVANPGGRLEKLREAIKRYRFAELRLNLFKTMLELTFLKKRIRHINPRGSPPQNSFRPPLIGENDSRTASQRTYGGVAEP